MLPYESKYHFSTKKVLMMFKGRKCVVQALTMPKFEMFSIKLEFNTKLNNAYILMELTQTEVTDMKF